MRIMKNIPLTLFASISLLFMTSISQAATLKFSGLIDGVQTEAELPSQSFTILNAVIEATDLSKVLDGPGPFTLFAPTDEAFLASFSQEELDELLADDADKEDDLNTLRALLMRHVVGNKILSGGLIDELTLTVSDLTGSDVDIFLESDVITVLNATVVEADILASNGAMHVIDAVLVL